MAEVGLEESSVGSISYSVVNSNDTSSPHAWWGTGREVEATWHARLFILCTGAFHDNRDVAGQHGWSAILLVY